MSRIWRAFVESITEGPLQRMRLRGADGTTREEGIERMQPYGLASKPVSDSEAICISLDASQVIVAAVDCSAHRPQDLQAGEVCVWHNLGARVTMKANGDIVLEPKSGAKILLGAGSDPIARKSDVDAVVGNLNSHTHLFSEYIPGVGLAAPATIPAVTVPFVAPSCSSKVVTT